MAETLSFEQVGEIPSAGGMRSEPDVPRVLLVATERWYPTARIGRALSEAGCAVDAVCPTKHPLRLTTAVRRMYKYKGLRPLSSVLDAIHASRPDLVVPADDLATWHLHELHQCHSSRGAAGQEICSLIERSVGSADNFLVIGARNGFMRVAREEGIRVPETKLIANASDLHDWIARAGFPMVLKANGTSGGDGVKVLNTVVEAESAFRKLQSPPLLARAVKRAVIDRDLTLLQPSFFRHRRLVTAQTFIAGHEATSALFCWKGEVLASLHFEVLEKVGSTGHATVVRRLDHPDMSVAADTIAKRLQLSGFQGLDFMIEDETGKAYLIEINPRTTQVGHLTLGDGRDLPAALYAVLTGQNVRPAAKVTEGDTVALFPQEWKRDPCSQFLRSAYHDVPWNEPAMVNACAGIVQKQHVQHTVSNVAPMKRTATSPRSDTAAIAE